MKRKLASVGVVVAVVFMTTALGCSSSSSDDNAGVTSDGGNGDSTTIQPGVDGGADASTIPFPDAALTPINFTAIGDAATDLVAPGRGAEFWNGADPAIDIPTAGSPAQSLNFYYRFQWDDFEDATKGDYSWTKFDNLIHQAIDVGQSFSFGIMPMCQGCGSATVGGSIMDYPMYLHTEMQGEATKDWNDTTDQIWVPNWNSNFYLSGWEAAADCRREPHCDDQLQRGCLRQRDLFHRRSRLWEISANGTRIPGTKMRRLRLRPTHR